MCIIKITICLLSSCAGNRQAEQQSTEQANRNQQMARELYLDAALCEFDGQHQQAIAVYLQALRFDSSSAQIHQSIGKNYLRLGQYRPAIDHLERSLKSAPEQSETLYLLAEAYFILENWPVASQHFQALFQLLPLNPQVHQRLISLYTRTGQTEKLVQLREMLAKQLGGDDASFDQLFALYIRIGDYPAAGQLVEERLNEMPGDSETWMKLATVQEKQQDTLRAINSYRHILKLEPGHQKAINQIYYLYAHKGDWQTLAGEMQHLITQDSLLYQARLYLGEALLKTGDAASARSWLTPLTRLPQYEYRGMQAMVNVAIAQQQSGEAIRLLERLIKMDDQGEKHWELLGSLYLQRGEAIKAEEVLLKAIVKHPQAVSLLTLLGDALQQQRKYQQALPVLQKSYDIAPEDLGTIISLGVVFDALQMYADSDALYRSALRTFPGNTLLLNNYAFSLAERKVDLGIALHMAEAALQENPTSSIYLDTVAWVFYQSGEFTRARTYAIQAVNDASAGPEVWEHLGDIENQLGNKAAARKAWNRALQMIPNDQQLQKKLDLGSDK